MLEDAAMVVTGKLALELPNDRVVKADIKVTEDGTVELKFRDAELVSSIMIEALSNRLRGMGLYYMTWLDQ